MILCVQYLGVAQFVVNVAAHELYLSAVSLGGLYNMHLNMCQSSSQNCNENHL